MSTNRTAAPFDPVRRGANAAAPVPASAGDGAIDDLSTVCGEAVRALREGRDFDAARCACADALVVVLDGHGRVIGLNDVCERLMQYTASEVRGRPFCDLFLLPEEAGAVRTAFADPRASQFPNTHQNRWRRRDGALRHVAWAAIALLGPDGAVRQIVAKGVDITARAEAEDALRESEARFQRIVANVPGVVYQFVLRADGTSGFSFVSCA